MAFAYVITCYCSFPGFSRRQAPVLITGVVLSGKVRKEVHRMDVLPRDVLILIFDVVRSSESTKMGVLRSVCSQWRRLLSQLPLEIVINKADHDLGRAVKVWPRARSLLVATAAG